jgi:hypothetical protein
MAKKLLVLIALVISFGVLLVLELKGFMNLRSAGPAAQIAPNIAQQPLVEINIGISTEVRDLLKIVYALDRYKQTHRSYPISSSEGGKWDGIISSYGESREDWIRGLVPEYVDSLPRDPRMLNDGTKQYIYKSDGANYKLIAHKVANCQQIKNALPSLVDPIRDCSAIGFWTKRAASW